MTSSSAFKLLIVSAILFSVLDLAASGQDVKADSKEIQNITLLEEVDRLDELKDMLADRLMQIDQIRSELGGRERSCSAKDQECRPYYRVSHGQATF